MATFEIYNLDKTVSERIDLDETVFDAPINDYFLHQVLVSYQANKRQGTHKTKTRHEVSGGGKKPFRQKGTGRARQGTTRAAQHRGGERQFGPVPRSYRQAIPKKMKQEAFRQCLSLKARSGKCFLLSDFNFPEIKTKIAANLLKTFEAKGRTLFVDAKPDNKTLLAIRNLPSAAVQCVNSCSPLDIFESDNIFLTKAAAELYQQRYGKQGGR
ncbi:MAG: 50S ribosomal protein L4 [Candidatus Omnitrophota bacterium]